MNYFSPVFLSKNITKYGFGRHAMITVTDPVPVDYVQLRRDVHVLVVRQVANPDIVETFTQDRFHELVEAGKVKVDPRRFDKAWQEVRALNPDLERGMGLADEESDEIEYYRRLVHRINDLYAAKLISLTDKGLKAAIDQVRGELNAAITTASDGEIGARKSVRIPKKPSPGTVRRWRLRMLSLNDHRLALRDRRHSKSGNRAARIDDPLVLSILATHTNGYLSSNRPTIAHQHKLMRADIADRNKLRQAEGLTPLTVPSKSTLERAIRKLDRFDVILAREGETAVKRALKVSGRQELATRPGERVPIDNWRSNISLKDLPTSFWEGVPEDARKKIKGRLNLGVALCQATKCILGLQLSANADAASALRTLQMVCMDKTDIAIAAGCKSAWAHRATPEIVPFDNGPEFANFVMTNATRELGAEIEFGIAGEPNGRPMVERFLRTTDVQFLPNFTGRTFANIAEKGDYDPAAMASAVVEVLSKALVRWVVDVYHNEPHAGLGGETPNDAWERASEEFGALPPPDADQMRAIFGYMDEGRLTNRGYRSFGLYYKNMESAQLRAVVGQANVLCKVDLQNLGHISLRAKTPDAPWITVPCEQGEFEGISAERWIRVATDLRQKHADGAKLREEVVLDAIRDLDEIGRNAADAAGIAPVLLTDEKIRQAKKKVFNAFNIVVPRERGKALKAMAAGTGSDGVAAPTGTQEPSPESQADASPAVTGVQPIARNRRGLGSNILKDK